MNRRIISRYEAKKKNALIIKQIFNISKIQFQEKKKKKKMLASTLYFKKNLQMRSNSLCKMRALDTKKFDSFLQMRMKGKIPNINKEDKKKNDMNISPVEVPSDNNDKKLLNIEKIPKLRKSISMEPQNFNFLLNGKNYSSEENSSSSSASEKNNFKDTKEENKINEINFPKSNFLRRTLKKKHSILSIQRSSHVDNLEEIPFFRKFSRDNLINAKKNRRHNTLIRGIFNILIKIIFLIKR